MLDHHHQEGRGSLSVLEYQNLKFHLFRISHTTTEMTEFMNSPQV